MSLADWLGPALLYSLTSEALDGGRQLAKEKAAQAHRSLKGAAREMSGGGSSFYWKLDFREVKLSGKVH